MSLPHERQAILSLASLYVFRMLGLFMVLPVLVLSGQHYAGSTPFLLGIALGAYGLSQACLQIPFGSLSDRLGRKPMIAFGLGLFALGSIVAASAETIEGLIVGRVLQGAGAIAGVIMAMVSDLTSPENRTKAMASIGASIGVAFAIALVIGPLLASLGGIRLIFWATAALSLIGFVVLFVWVPRVSQQAAARSSGRFLDLLRDARLIPLNVGIFVLHFVLMGLFVALPLILLESLGIEQSQHAWIYLGLLLSAFIAMVPVMIIAERKGLVKPFILIAIASLAVALIGLIWQAEGLVWVIVCAWLFFVGFNYLEASLPSLISKILPPDQKGVGSGLFSTCQFLGAALGGFSGGWLYDHYSIAGVFTVCALLIVAWLLIALGMKVPTKLKQFAVPLNGHDYQQLAPRLLELPGVKEATYVQEEEVAYLTVDQQSFDRRRLVAIGLGGV